MNLRTQFERILTKAGVAPWPRLWQNLRASRATELADRFPGHVCAAWLGHTDAVADKHYRQTTPAHLAAAIGMVAETPEREGTNAKMLTNAKVKAVTPNVTQQASEMARSGRKQDRSLPHKGLIFPTNANGCEPLQTEGWERQDSNTSEFLRESADSATTYAQSYALAAIDPDFARIAARWPKLPAAVRRAIVAMADVV